MQIGDKVEIVNTLGMFVNPEQDDSYYHGVVGVIISVDSLRYRLPYQIKTDKGFYYVSDSNIKKVE